jgi:hypothetical protein
MSLPTRERVLARTVVEHVTPPYRLVVVEAWGAQAKAGGAIAVEHRVYQAVAVRATTHIYEDGQVESEYDPIILDHFGDGAAKPLSDLLGSNSKTMIVPCHWPESDDSRNLALTIAGLREDALSDPAKE